MKIIGEEITVARQPENMAKNRYTNILPYDNFRVILGEFFSFVKKYLISFFKKSHMKERVDSNLQIT